eukprot:CAMPEP_0116877964 /NCGR_PEP_ID=MMETSP0463-20121206/9719_1 /TAXON_ID=181622 /ORGANISM="Strombidinopsis sp, Strain SopsisLIS2011" /LENGTH=60 /DNA_ID=CAMNT_0004525721 /DNA_START=645 /DNA_END=827 /DNA_ORIENTATION=-
MTEKEREEENLKLGDDHNSKKQKVAYNFMQKYYHKGAFFRDDMDDSTKELLSRDFNMPTG